jgi:hypothetical protein
MFPQSRRQPREDGAALVIALVFVLVMSLVIVAILDLSASNILASTQLQNGRALEYSADGAADAVIQAIRYLSPSATSNYCGKSPAYQPPAPIDAVTMYCKAATPQYQRIITVVACPSGLGTCNATSTSGAALVAAVIFSDIKSSCTDGTSAGCYVPTGGPGSTSGASVTIESWVVNRANG